METQETERLFLRPFAESDFDAVHSYASCYENVKYMPWGPNDDSDTYAFISRAITESEETPCRNYEYAAVLKETVKLVGACSISLKGKDEAELGWILHRNYWRHGLGTEMGAFLLRFGFEDLNLRRIIAHCDTDNYGSYRVMERIGMRREGTLIENRPANKQSGKKYCDEYSYAVLKDEYDTQKEIRYYNSLPVSFIDFIEVPKLADDEIELFCIEKIPAIPEKRFVPAYRFEIRKDGQKIGAIHLRIGYTEGLYYGGNIGYGIDEAFRGHNYAMKACKLLVPVIKAHGLTKILITNDYTNIASRRTCEKLGAKLLRVARLPEWHDLYQMGRRFSNIFEWSIINSE
jgi:[ribosomal protein S5]-alanine N-acetyltransferase